MDVAIPGRQPLLPELQGLFDAPADQGAAIRLDLKAYLLGLWQGRYVVLMSFLICLSVSVPLALLMLKPTWSAQITILKKERQDEFSVGTNGNPFRPQEYSFGTLLDTLLLPGTLKMALVRSNVSMPPHEFARLVDVRVGKASKAFTISVLWEDPVKAAVLTQNLANVFVERNRELRKKEIKDSLGHYAEGLAAAERQVSETTTQLMAFEAENDLADVQTQLRVLLENRQLILVRINETEADVFAKREQITRMKQQIEAEPSMIVQASYFVNPLAKNLTQLEWELTQAKGRYTEENPKVVDLQKRIEDLRQVIEEGKDQRSPSETMADNPVRRDLSLQRYIAKSELVRLESQLMTLKETQAQLDAGIRKLSATRKEHSSLLSKHDAAVILQQNLQERVDSLRVMVKGRIGDFEILEAAAVPDSREPSGRRILVAFLSLLGAAAAMAYILMRDFLKRPVRSLKELEFTHGYELAADFSAGSENIDYHKFANDLRAYMVKTGRQNLAVVSVDDSVEPMHFCRELALNISRLSGSVILVDADLTDGAKPINLLSNRMPVEITAEGTVDLPPESRQGLTLVRFPETQERSLRQISAGHMVRLRETLTRHGEINIYRLPAARYEESFEAIQAIGHVMLVVEANSVSAVELEALRRRFDLHGVDCDVAVLTKVDEALHSNGAFRPVVDLQRDIQNMMRSCRRRKTG